MRRRKGSDRGQYQLASANDFSIANRPRFSFLDPHMYVSLKYVETVGFTNATTVASQYIWNVNSLFDPNRTGTGHEPYGFDQLATLYNRYRVLKCKYKVTFASVTTSQFTCVGPSNGLISTPIVAQGSFEGACELPWFRSKPTSPSGPTVVYKGTLSLNELNGVTQTEYLADDRFEAQVGASPAEIMVLYLGVYNPTGSTVTIYSQTELLYEIDFHDPIIQAQS